jgi:hypothetical protein
LFALAEDVGRLRRRAEPESLEAHLADRIAGHVEVLDALLQPTAAELHADGVSVEDSLAFVDERVEELSCLLGLDQARTRSPSAAPTRKEGPHECGPAR